MARFRLGEAFERLSEFENALANYRSALRHIRAGNWENKTKLEAGTLLHMGKIHRWLSQYEEAIELLQNGGPEISGARQCRGTSRCSCSTRLKFILGCRASNRGGLLQECLGDLQKDR